MTQQKREPKTLLQRMGFSDPDLGDPLHTEILKWIDSKIESHDFASLGIMFHPESTSNDLLSYRWESPVEGSGQLVGFLDGLATFHSHYTPEFFSSFNPGGKNGGFQRPRVLLEIGFEAKVILPPLELLLRQLSVYRHYGYPNLIVVCLGDVSESDIQIIRKQGYGFVQPCHLDPQK